MVKGRATREHIAGFPVSAGTYRQRGCRCEGCTAANTRAVRADRHARDRALLRVQNRAQHKAVSYVRSKAPALWEQFLAEAYEELGIERRRPGRPRD